MEVSIICGVDFVPVTIETSGARGKQAIGLIKEIGRRIAAITYDHRSTSFLRQRLSIAVHRETRPAFLGHCPKRALPTSRPIPVADQTWIKYIIPHTYFINNNNKNNNNNKSKIIIMIIILSAPQGILSEDEWRDLECCIKPARQL